MNYWLELFKFDKHNPDPETKDNMDILFLF